MHILAQLLLIPLAYGLFKLGRFLLRIWRSPLHNLPGPKSSSLLFGNLPEVFKAVRIAAAVHVPQLKHNPGECGYA